MSIGSRIESWYEGNSQRVEALSKILDLIGKLLIIIGIPYALYQAVTNWEKERESRLKNRQYQELQTYVSCKDLWWSYLEEYRRHPDTNFGPFSDDQSYNPQFDTKTDDIFVNYQFTLFERCFLFFHDKPEEFKREQWDEWKDYIVETMQRKQVEKKWDEFGWGYDSRFQHFVNVEVLKRPPKKT